MSDIPQADERRKLEEPPRPEKPRRPYRTPQVVTRPLFERMALGCPSPWLGNPY